MAPHASLLEVRNLCTRFDTAEGTVHAVNGISYRVEPGETIAVVGESGSGKSVSMMSMLGLLPSPPARIAGGEVLFKGQDLLKLDRKAMRKLNGNEIGMIFQDPMSSLNPVLTVGFQIGEAVRVHQKLDREAARKRAEELLGLVGIPDPARRLKQFPHQFSGGMRQRVMIAMALACEPALLIADEPTTALDVTIQAQILRLVKRLRQKMGMSVIWITHDLGVVARLAERVVVMYAGTIVEDAAVSQFYARPRHPYSMGLLGSLPRLDAGPGSKLQAIGGQPPNLVRPPVGCAFAPRCRYALPLCREAPPPLEQVGPTDRDRVACWRKDEIEGAPHVH
ncbi:oligopeptide transport system ATP-binding protein [Devosia enhydra]|uniref:Oligopeptide transport system ATP-binding protein n=1 Tax=Devosia enhydra TaxID=665118 RepID=A0A1K2HZN4_9HYPH|nr:ABC transporter ATP-binding protein [Devosia enhydra]SFZ85586.1 oligopeptide transport system ATP-binding protein [Devosia enhydra]